MILDLFLTFFKIGIFSYGGGYVVTSFLQQEALAKGWLTLSEFSNIVAVSQITPGPIGINMATFVGYKQAGIPGSLVASLGVCLPSILIVLVAIRFIERFNNSKTIKTLFWGLRPAVTGLILAASMQIASSQFFPEGFTSQIEWRSIVISIIAFIAIFKFKVNPIIVILVSAVAGIFIFGGFYA